MYLKLFDVVDDVLVEGSTVLGLVHGPGDGSCSQTMQGQNLHTMGSAQKALTILKNYFQRAKV